MIVNKISTVSLHKTVTAEQMVALIYLCIFMINSKKYLNYS